MNIQILSRRNFRRLLEQTPNLLETSKVISINDPLTPTLYENEDSDDYGHYLPDHPNVLSLEFHDAEPGSLYAQKSQFIFFSKPEAEAIINFLKTCSREDKIFIHCWAGISRSSAVAWFTAEYLGYNFEQLRKYHPWIVPNSHVYSTLRNTYYQMHTSSHLSRTQGI